jgi:hypothetical protein
MPRVGFELTIPKFARAEIFHALDRAATVAGFEYSNCLNYVTGLETKLNVAFNLYTRSLECLCRLMKMMIYRYNWNRKLSK